MYPKLIEVAGGSLVATAAVATITVEETPTNFTIIITDLLGGRWIYDMCSSSEEAHSEVEGLVNAIGQVVRMM